MFVCRHLWVNGKPIETPLVFGHALDSSKQLGKEADLSLFPQCASSLHFLNIADHLSSPILPIQTQKIGRKGVWGFSGLNVGVSGGECSLEAYL